MRLTGEVDPHAAAQQRLGTRACAGAAYQQPPAKAWRAGVLATATYEQAEISKAKRRNAKGRKLLRIQTGMP